MVIVEEESVTGRQASRQTAGEQITPGEVIRRVVDRRRTDNQQDRRSPRHSHRRDVSHSRRL